MPSLGDTNDALLMEALRPYVGPADLDSLVLRERFSQQRLVLTLSFMCTCQSARIKRSASCHCQIANGARVKACLRANATNECILKLARYVMSEHACYSEHHSDHLELP
jgi:hypothetical protein